MDNLMQQFRLRRVISAALFYFHSHFHSWRGNTWFVPPGRSGSSVAGEEMPGLAGHANGTVSGGLTYVAGAEGRAFEFNGTIVRSTLVTRVIRDERFFLFLLVKDQLTRYHEGIFEKRNVCNGVINSFALPWAATIGLGKMFFSIAGDNLLYDVDLKQPKSC